MDLALRSALLLFLCFCLFFNQLRINPSLWFCGAMAVINPPGSRSAMDVNPPGCRSAAVCGSSLQS